MSESATPGFAGDAAADGASPLLTAEQVEAILADFRDWLRESAATAPADPPAELIDLHTLIAQFVALRQEVNLQTRAVRQQQEQNAETLQRYSESLELLDAALKQAPGDDQERERPLVTALIDAADTQQRAAAEMARLVQLLKTLADAPLVDLPEPPRPGVLARFFGARAAQQEWLAAVVRSVQEQGRLRLADGKPPEQVRAMVESAASGLAMGLQRIERAMAQVELEPIAALGRAFDPEEMEAVAVVADSGRLPGEVIEEVRRGWRFRGRVWRFAQVRVAK